MCLHVVRCVQRPRQAAGAELMSCVGCVVQVDGTCWSNRCTKTTHADPYSGWNIFSNSWTWWIDNLSPGVHTFEIQVCPLLLCCVLCCFGKGFENGSCLFLPVPKVVSAVGACCRHTHNPV